MLSNHLLLSNCAVRLLRCPSACKRVSTSVRGSDPVAYIKIGKARLFQEGNPIIFDGVLQNISADPKPMAGDEIIVADQHGNVIGKGAFNPDSLYRVRVLALKSETCFAFPLIDIIKFRIESAYKLRKDCLMIHSTSTSAYRLINSEGDRISGLIVDIFGTVAVVQSAALWIEKRKNLVIDALKFVLGDTIKIIWKKSTNFLKLDGYTFPEEEEDTDTSVQNYQDIDIIENEIKYRVKPGSGQKTGFYCDQRSNRLILRSLCQGKRVLDLFCFTGGFSLNAMEGGCASVIGVDSSELAIDAANLNLRLNDKLDQTKCIFKRSDAVDYMKNCLSKGDRFDVIILDPPKLAPNAKALEKATKKYIALNALAMQLLNEKEGGLLFTFSCSAAVAQSPGRFQDIIVKAGRNANRTGQILATCSAAADHPVLSSYPENKYLSGYLIRVCK